jgi:hypothetical protein
LSIYNNIEFIGAYGDDDKGIDAGMLRDYRIFVAAN